MNQATDSESTIQTATATEVDKSTSNTSLLQRLSARRVAFFAKHEALFLWLLAPPVLIFCLIILVSFVLWLSGQGAALESILNGKWVPG